MKKIWIITGFAAIVIGMVSCNKTRRSPGRAYMPDMAYSRAYETYATTEGLQKEGVHYTALPVKGTIARGDILNIYPYENDLTGYEQSGNVKNPFKADSIDLKESERLYLVNCGICHGTKLDGNGPLYNDGKGPYTAAPKNLMGDDMKKLPEGTMFHSVTYGKGQMGSYASQLSTTQRWMVIAYIKSKQGGGMAVADTSAKAPADTAMKMK
ncbi:MAG: c-type cytochrome [Chitinophagaceae bacterium]